VGGICWEANARPGRDDLGQRDDPVDQTAVPLALPDIANDLQISSHVVQWVLNASLLPLAGLTVLGGRLADLLGRRKIFVTGSILFAGASVLGVSRRPSRCCSPRGCCRASEER
jgi:MFS transporter